MSTPNELSDDLRARVSTSSGNGAQLGASVAVSLSRNLASDQNAVIKTVCQGAATGKSSAGSRIGKQRSGGGRQALTMQSLDGYQPKRRGVSVSTWGCREQEGALLQRSKVQKKYKGTPGPLLVRPQALLKTLEPLTIDRGACTVSVPTCEPRRRQQQTGSVRNLD